MKRLFISLLTISLVCFSFPSHSFVDPMTVGFSVDKAKEAADDLVQNSFDRLDLSVMQAAMEVRATINESSILLQDVMNSTVEQLDGQQRRVVNDLHDFERLVSTDMTKALKEIREEKNSVISELRLIISNSPGSLRIIPGYTLQGREYIDFRILGSALSKAKLENTKLNSKKIRFDIIKQSDTQLVIRVPIKSELASQLLKKSSGKPAEAKISFELSERSWFDLFETGRRKFSEVGYILPKKIGTAKAVFYGEVEKIVKKKKKLEFISKPVMSSLTFTGRKRGREEKVHAINPDPGWLIDTETAQFKFEYLDTGCNKRRSTASWVKKEASGISIKTITVTHLGRRSVCKTKTTTTITQSKKEKELLRITTNSKEVMANNDITFQLSLSDLRRIKNPRLDHVEIISPLFENGSKILRPGGEMSNLRLEYNASSHIAFLQSAYLE